MSKSGKRTTGDSQATKKAAGSPARKVTQPASRALKAAKKSAAKTNKTVRANRPMLKSGKPLHAQPPRTHLLRAPQAITQSPAPAREKVSLTIPAAVMEEVRGRAASGQISAYVTRAIQDQLDRDNLADLLAEMEQANGPLTEAEIEAALAQWPTT